MFHWFHSKSRSLSDGAATTAALENDLGLVFSTLANPLGRPPARKWGEAARGPAVASVGRRARSGRAAGGLIAGLAAVVLTAAGTALSLGINGDLPVIWQTSSSDRTTTLESAVIPDMAASLATQASGGFEVSILSDTEEGGERVIGYAVSLPSERFTDMLGIPRFVNPDGSFVLPSEYGAVSAGDGSGRPGLAAAVPSAAIFDSERIQPGAVLRFGPFFQALDQGATLDATAVELAAGHDVTIGDAPFRVSLSTLEDGIHELRFEPLSTEAQIVASHPGSRVTVTVNGTVLTDIKGSTNFAKTEELDVNANQSAVVVGGDIPSGAIVSVSIDSIGRVTKGNWDFPLN